MKRTDVFAPQPPNSALVASICRCSSPAMHAQRAADSANESFRISEAQVKQRADAAIEAVNVRAAELASRTPNPDAYAVEEVEQVGEHLVMKVRYPNCAKCAYEGSKVMVFLDTTLKSAIKWRRIDPHFRAPGAPATLPATQTEAPSPAARFPASRDGWSDALTYARGKAQ